MLQPPHPRRRVATQHRVPFRLSLHLSLSLSLTVCVCVCRVQVQQKLVIVLGLLYYGMKCILHAKPKFRTLKKTFAYLRRTQANFHIN